MINYHRVVVKKDKTKKENNELVSNIFRRKMMAVWNLKVSSPNFVRYQEELKSAKILEYTWVNYSVHADQGVRPNS